MRVLSIAATGMSAQQLNVEVIANNIANVNTTGFKRSRAEFTDLLYQIERSSSVPSAAGDTVVPEGAELGLGTRLSSIRNINIQGPISNTGNQLDIAINGDGWLQVRTLNSEIAYTRAGSLNTDANGQLVNGDGLPIEPAITIPPETVAVTINKTGEVFARSSTGTETQVGQITLASFANPAGLHALGGNLFQATEASGTATVANPGTSPVGVLEQGYLEESNVDPVQEITELISAQRAYELNSKVIQAADDMAGIVSKGIR
ncbi:MAG: flagellar basal-body rod protein FlgG [Proteobacteria bacterium]|nr:flagellar basal-body rod protein FlgG [Pseudomonadota bacterium]